MHIDIVETKTHPHRTVTDWPFVRLYAKVVLKPNGTAIIAKDLQVLEFSLGISVTEVFSQSKDTHHTQ